MPGPRSAAQASYAHGVEKTPDPRIASESTLETLAEVADLEGSAGREARRIVSDAEALKEGAFRRAEMMEKLGGRLEEVVKALDSRLPVAAALRDWRPTVEQRQRLGLTDATERAVLTVLREIADNLENPKPVPVTIGTAPGRKMYDRAWDNKGE